MVLMLCWGARRRDQDLVLKDTNLTVFPNPEDCEMMIKIGTYFWYMKLCFIFSDFPFIGAILVLDYWII